MGPLPRHRLAARLDLTPPRLVDVHDSVYRGKDRTEHGADERELRALTEHPAHGVGTNTMARSGSVACDEYVQPVRSSAQPRSVQRTPA